MSVLRRTLDGMSDALLVAGCVLTFLMMAHVSADVLGKLVLNQPINGTLEIVTYYYMVGCVFLPLPAVQRRRGQIVVEVFTHVLPRRALLALDGVVSLASAAFTGMLTWYAGAMAISRTELREVIPSPQLYLAIWPARWFVVLSMGAVTCYLLLQAVENLAEAALACPGAAPVARRGSEMPIA